MNDRPEPRVYGYVAIHQMQHNLPPYRGQVMGLKIEDAWKEVLATKMPAWKPGIYRAFVYSRLTMMHEDYQSAAIIIKEGETTEVHYHVAPVGP